MKRLLLLAAALAFLIVGCGDDSPTDTTTASDTTTVTVYFLRDGQVWPVRREVVVDGFISRVLYNALEQGPTEDEIALGFTTEVPADGSEATSPAGLAQVTYTLTQDAPEADFYAGRFSRDDFEEQTPSVFVESPAAFEEVEAPLTVTGTANTFEANFQYELLDSEGDVVDENFVTATSGTGTRGTFVFTTADVDDVATLVVFEASAEDGSRMREVEIPLTQVP